MDNINSIQQVMKMAVETKNSIFCSCGGLWVVKNEEDEKYFSCPICGAIEHIPSDTSSFQIKF
jgi:hypothetical protein